LTACRGEKLFGEFFRDPANWEAWMAFIALVFNLTAEHWKAERRVAGHYY
jgi:hypothetical protein